MASAKGRNGPRERQTMSGILGERRDPKALAESVATDAATGPLPASVIVDPHLSLWQRVVRAAEREFDKDEPPSGGPRPEGGRVRDGR